MTSLTTATDIAVLRNDVVVATDSVRQYIIFTIDGQEYGISIMDVREIRGWTPENKLPNLPAYVRGVINLRGTVIPIIDLRARFGVGTSEAGKYHVVIITQVGERTSGLLVDAISDILPIPDDQLKPAPNLDRGAASAHYIDELFTPEGRIIALLDVAHVCACH